MNENTQPWTAERLKAAIKAVQTRCATDADFQALALKSPLAAVGAVEGVAFGMPSEGELTDLQLDQVAGGSAKQQGSGGSLIQTGMLQNQQATAYDPFSQMLALYQSLGQVTGGSAAFQYSSPTHEQEDAHSSEAAAEGNAEGNEADVNSYIASISAEITSIIEQITAANDIAPPNIHLRE